MQPSPIRKVLQCCIVGAISMLLAASATFANAATPSGDKMLAPGTRFFVPFPAYGSLDQALSLFEQGKSKDGILIEEMEFTPQAVWLVGGTPYSVGTQVKGVMVLAAAQQTVPVFVLYNIPGRDCGSYSAGGAQNTAAYQAWVDAIAAAIGTQKAVITLEPDALANLPSDCGYDPAVVDAVQATADRLAQIKYAVTTLEAQQRTLVYLDAGNSGWHSPGDMAKRLLSGGLLQTQGFFSNSSNFRASPNEVKFGTWISQCLAFGSNPEEGGWRLGHYDWCASQYYSPLGNVNSNDFSTWVYTDMWYATNMGTAVATTHFLVDTGRNGQGAFDAGVYAKPPYNQPAWVVQTLNNGGWCNPPARGLGQHPTARTGIALLDAYLWIKTPGQSDGSCDAQGYARAWDYSAYTQPGWPTDAAGQKVFDPLWGLNNPSAGGWFPEQALDLALRASPALPIK